MNRDHNPSPLDEQLYETAWGAWIADHKGLSLSIITVLFVSIIGYFSFKYIDDRRNDTAAQAVYQFERDFLVPFEEDALSVEELLSAWDDLYRQHPRRRPLLPVLLYLSDQMMEQEKLEQAQALLESAVGQFRGNFSRDLIAMRLAVVYEDLALYEQAIEQLQTLESSALNLLGSKVYFDLGRLYFRMERFDRARASFEYLLGQMAQEEFAAMARIYLAQMDQQ